MAKFSVFKDLKPTTPVPQISFKSAFYDENESAVVFHTKKRSCTKSKAIYYTSPLEDITWAYLDSSIEPTPAVLFNRDYYNANKRSSPSPEPFEDPVHYSPFKCDVLSDKSFVKNETLVQDPIDSLQISCIDQSVQVHLEQESIVLKKKKNDQDDVSLKPKVKEIDLKVKETLVDDLKIDEKLNQLVEELKVESNDKQPEAEYLDDEQDVNVLEKPQEKEDNKHHVEEIQVPKQPKDEQETKLIEKEQDSTEKQVKDQIKACPISALKQECNENETNETEIKNVIKESNTVVKKEKGQDKKKKKRVVVNKVVGVEREMPSMRSFR